MRLAHVSDTHLGVRRYRKTTPTGANCREADVALAFRTAVDQIIAARPAVVVHSGDVFDAVQPSNACSLFAYRQFKRLREGLPDAPIIVIAGNHSTPRSAGVGSPLDILRELGVHVATTRAETFRFPALDLAVRCLPHAALMAGERPGKPEGPERFRVLTLHGDIVGVSPTHGEYGGAMVEPDELAGGWSYVALGHYHVQHEVAPRVWYAGALDYVTSNLWGELADEAEKGVRGKAWLLADLATGEVTSQRVPQARPIYDLDPVHGIGLTAPEVMAEIASRVDGVPGGIEGAVVRLRVLQVDRAVARQLDFPAIRRWKAQALHFRLDVVPVAREVAPVDGSDRRRMPLDQVIAEYLASRVLPPGMDRAAFTAIGTAVLAEEYGA